MTVIDKLAPMKERRIKQNSQEWFDREIVAEMKVVIIEKSKLHIEKYIYNAARYKVRRRISNKKITFFERKLPESIAKFKYLWKALKSLGLLNNTSSCEVSALKINNTVEHDVNSVYCKLV